MKYRNKNDEKITKKYFIDEIDFLINTLENLKLASKDRDKESFNSIFDNDFSVDFLFNTRKENDK